MDDDQGMVASQLPKCAHFHSMGYCSRFPPLAKDYCPVSCGVCGLAAGRGAPQAAESTLQQGPPQATQQGQSRPPERPLQRDSQSNTGGAARRPLQRESQSLQPVRPMCVQPSCDHDPVEDGPVETHEFTANGGIVVAELQRTALGRAAEF